MLGITLRWIKGPFRGNSSTPSCLILQKAELSARSVDRLVALTRKKLNCMGHTTQLRGMASTLRLRTAISPEQWRLRTAVLTFLGLISMA